MNINIYMQKARKIPRKDDKLIESINQTYAGDKVVPYMGNSSLPSKESTFEYDKDRVKVILRCAENILYFAQHFFYIISAGEKIKINLHPFQRDSLRMFRDHQKSIMNCSRQVGKTTLMTIYALWLVTLYDYQHIVIVANKEKTAQEILDRIRLAYTELPNWLKPTVENWAKQEVKFTNGSKIQISATSADAIRGKSCNCLIVDEMGHIDAGIMEEFWAAVYPTISADDKSKVLIASTPNSVGNKFHELWEKSHITNSGWGYVRVPWFDVPGKTEEWAAQQRIDLGDDMFEQEYECKFLEGGDSCIPEDLYNELQKRCINPRVTMYDGKYKIFAEPNIKDRIYVAGVDIGEGVGACASTINIMDVTEMTAIEQVATYHSTSVGPYEFARQLNDILGHWGKPPVAIERNNSGGGVVVTRMDKDYNYPNIIHFATKQGNMSYGHLKGVTSSTNTKYHGVMNMFYWLKTQRRVILRDIDTLKELNTFVRHKNEKWAKKSDSYLDDRVDAMLWSLIAIHEMVVKQYFTILMWDDNKKPLMLKPLYHVFDSKENRYVFGGEDNNFGVDRLIMPSVDHDPHLDEMNDIGWLLPEQAGHTPSYEPAEKYFTG